MSYALGYRSTAVLGAAGRKGVRQIAGVVPGAARPTLTFVAPGTRGQMGAHIHISQYLKVINGTNQPLIKIYFPNDLEAQVPT